MGYENHLYKYSIFYLDIPLGLSKNISLETIKNPGTGWGFLGHKKIGSDSDMDKIIYKSGTWKKWWGDKIGMSVVGAQIFG